tara:strand:- start:74 stop:277 length:204 start_codon:yes stop_codon:yes gene_type:complete
MKPSLILITANQGIPVKAHASPSSINISGTFLALSISSHMKAKIPSDSSLTDGTFLGSASVELLCVV